MEKVPNDGTRNSQSPPESGSDSKSAQLAEYGIPSQRASEDEQLAANVDTTTAARKSTLARTNDEDIALAAEARARLVALGLLQPSTAATETRDDRHGDERVASAERYGRHTLRHGEYAQASEHWRAEEIERGVPTLDGERANASFVVAATPTNTRRLPAMPVRR